MKIGIYDPYLDTMSGGERYMLSIASLLSEDHDVSIFWDTKQERHIRAEAKRKFAMDLSNISFVPSIFEADTPMLRRLIESRKYNRIFVLSDGSIPVLACPMILHFQTPTEWVQTNPILTEIKMMRTSKVICNSYFTKSYIDRKYKVESTVLYPPVVVEGTKEVKKEHIILHVGRFGIRQAGSSYKKQEVLARAFMEMLHEGLKHWKLVFIMGVNETEKKAAKEFARKLKHDSIHILMNPDLETVTDHYNRASLYWHASGYGEDLTRHPDRAEHFGISTVEAMGHGAVPVVINAGGQPEIVTNGENGYLWETLEELKGKTRKLIEEDTLRKHLAENAVARADDFTIERFRVDLSQIIS